jgi:hypothetical protein
LLRQAGKGFAIRERTDEGDGAQVGDQGGHGCPDYMLAGPWVRTAPVQRPL